MKKIVTFFIILFLLHYQLFSQSPVNDFEYNVTKINCDYVMVDFYYNSSSSSDVDSCCWYFGDGTENCNSHTNAAFHNYSQPGTYSVELFLWKGGIENLIEKNDIITVHEPPEPDFDYSVNDTSLFAPLNISLINNTIIGECDSLSYKWEFGDDSVSMEENPSHTYIEPDTYDILLIVNDTIGCEKGISKFIIVKDTAQKGEFEFITSGCYAEEETPPCGRDKHCEIRNDSLIIYGYYSGNCGTRKTATIRYSGDTVIVRTWEVGPETTCSCGYCFEIGVPNITQDSIIVLFNNQIYTAGIIGIRQRINIEKSINIYPNPAYNNLTVDLSDFQYNNFNFEIIDINGIIRQSGVLNHQNRIQIDRQTITKGLYIVLIRKDSEVKFTKRILIY